jgi:hypothetical protein
LGLLLFVGDLSPLLTEGKIGEGYRESWQQFLNEDVGRTEANEAFCWHYMVAV